MTEHIPSFRPEFSEPEIDFVAGRVRDIMHTGRLVLGPYTAQFESAMAEAAHREHGIAVNSGSTALEITYKTLGVKGKQVLLPTNTNFATAAAAAYAGGRVEFYDGGLYPSTEDLMDRLNHDTGAVAVVHIGGYISPEMEDIAETCRSLGVPLVEDAAHAHGATFRNRAAGSLGDVAAFSFFPTKTLTTGEGGVIVTDDASFAQKARQYRDQGKEPDGIIHGVWGNSWRMTEMGAALGLAQIGSLGTDTARRSAIIDRYSTELADTSLAFPGIEAGSRPSGYKAIAVLPENISRSALKRTLLLSGIQLGKEVYELPLHLQPIFKDYAQNNQYPEAESFASRHICLPLWRFMRDDQVEAVVEALRQELA